MFHISGFQAAYKQPSQPVGNDVANRRVIATGAGKAGKRAECPGVLTVSSQRRWLHFVAEVTPKVSKVWGSQVPGELTVLGMTLPSSDFHLVHKKCLSQTQMHPVHQRACEHLKAKVRLCSIMLVSAVPGTKLGPMQELNSGLLNKRPQTIAKIEGEKLLLKGLPLWVSRDKHEIWGQEESEKRQERRCPELLRTTLSLVSGHAPKDGAKYFVGIICPQYFQLHQQVDSSMWMNVPQPALGGCPDLQHLLISVVNIPIANFRLPV